MPSRFQKEVQENINKESSLSDEERYVPMDEAIEPFVEQLWNLGYWTEASCAGGHAGYESFGYVLLGQTLMPEERKEIRELAKEYNLINVRIIEEGIMTRIYFNPLGGKRWSER